MSACSKIRQIVGIRQMIRRRRWRKKACECDVPAGHVAVSVGSNCKRFVVRATYLNHPLFKKLLVQAEEEFGFANTGPLAIPCDESLFQVILSYLARNESGSARFATLDGSWRNTATSAVEATSIFGPSRGPSCTAVPTRTFGDTSSS